MHCGKRRTVEMSKGDKGDKDVTNGTITHQACPGLIVDSNVTLVTDSQKDILYLHVRFLEKVFRQWTDTPWLRSHCLAGDLFHFSSFTHPIAKKRKIPALTHPIVKKRKI